MRKFFFEQAVFFNRLCTTNLNQMSEQTKNSWFWIERRKVKLERITFTANGRNDHVTMFILHLPLTVFSFSVKSSSLALASKVRIILHYSCLCTNFSEENINANLTSAFAVNAILNLTQSLNNQQMLSSQLTKQDLGGKKGEPAMIGTGSSNFDCRDNGASFFFTNRSLQSITDIISLQNRRFFFFIWRFPGQRRKARVRRVGKGAKNK